MKKISLWSILLFTAIAANAQSRTSTVEYAKINRQAVVNEIPFPEKTVRNAIEDKMGKAGYKSKEMKGYDVYRGVRLSEIGTDTYDMYFMVDRKSRKDKEASIITLLLTKGFDNFISDSTDATVINNAKNYLNNIKLMIGAYDLEQQILEQEDAVRKAEKKKSNLIDDADNFQKKLKNLQDDIEKNIEAQKAQQTELEKQRQILDTLKSKRGQ